MLNVFLRKRAVEILSFLRRTWVGLTFAFAFFVLLFLFNSLSWEFWAERTFGSNGAITEIKIDRLKIVQQFGLFVAAIFGLGLAAWRSHTAYRQANAALAQSNTAIRQTEIAENGQRFDRYARAAQMLDNEKSAVRQAGIYLLRELALSDQNYRALCAELLASFIRSRNSDGLEQLASKGHATKFAFADKGTPHDVVDALKSLCRTRAGIKLDIDLSNNVFAKFEFDHFFNMASFYLNETVFSNMSGYGAVFDGSSFSGAAFQDLTFKQARFRKASFYSATFKNVDFDDVDFTGASIWDCTFESCTFKNCDVSDVSFHWDQGNVELPFDPILLKDSWAWKNCVPKLGTDFSGIVYDPGPDNKERKAFADTQEKRRVAGINYGDYKPSAKLRIV